MSGEAGGTHRPVKSSERTLQVLEAIAASPEPLSLGVLARTLGIPKSSLHAILRTMECRGWIQSDPSGHRFRLGLRAVSVGAAFARHDDVVSFIGPVLDRLAAEIDETVHLARLDGFDIIYLAKRESTQPLRMFSAVGRRLPAYTTALGKALLAELADRALEQHLPRRLVAYTPNTITDRSSLAHELAVIRERGYAIDNEENSEGLGCVAVTVPTATPPTDAISCSVPVVRFGAERRAWIVEHLVAARAEIGEAWRLSRPDA